LEQQIVLLNTLSHSEVVLWYN